MINQCCAVKQGAVEQGSHNEEEEEDAVSGSIGGER